MVRDLTSQGGIALMHNRTWGDFTENAAYLSIGSSERMAAPAGQTTLVGLRQYQPPVANRSEKVGELGQALSAQKVRFSVAPPASPVDMVALSGMVADSGTANIRLLYCPTPATANATVQTATSDRETDETLYVVAPYTPEIAGGKPYRRLGFLVAIGPGIAPDSLLTSPTTRTPGLIANVDIAPTIATHYNVAIPGAAGQPVRSVPARDTWGTLAAMDKQSISAARASIPVLLGYGIWAGMSLVLALFALWRPQPKRVAAARFVMLCSAAALLGLMPVGIIAPQSPMVYGAIFAGITVAIAAIALAIGKRSQQEPLRLVFLALVVAVSIDGFWGSPVLGRSLLSGNLLSGIRFYGIGNEYMGLTVGAAATALSPWWLCTVLVGVIGLPYFGADAGGTIGSVVTFAAQFFAHRGRLKIPHVIAAFAAAFVVTAVFAVLDRLQPGTARSHVGAAVATGEGHGGIHALFDIILRKITMNLRLAISPWTLVALGAMVPVGILLARKIRSSPGSLAALEKRGLLTVALPATAWGALATAVFNDSGIVAAVLMFLPVMVSLLDALLSCAVEQENHALHGD